MSFESFVAIYFNDVRDRIREHTMLTKENIINQKLLPFFGKRKMSEIQSKDIIAWQNELLAYRDKNGKGYSDTYLKIIHNQLSAILNHAVRYYNLSSNVAAKVGSIGKKEANEMCFWTKEEYQEFVDVMMDKPISFYAFEMLYWCGLRLGELLALTPADFDFQKETVSITKSYQRLSGRDVITEPKTTKSNRVISIPKFLCEEIQEFLNLLYGIGLNDRIFTITKSYLHKEMDRGSKVSGVKRIRIHDLRHSHVSLLNTFSDVTATTYYRRVTENPLMRPDGTEFQYNYKTLEKWTSDYRRNGLDGLTPKVRSDSGFTRRLSNECVSEIFQIKEKFPKLNASQIHMRLLELGFIDKMVSVRTIQRFVKTHNLKNGVPSTSTKDRKAFEEEFFCDLWMADTCYFPYIKENGVNRRTYLIAITDDHSRMIVGARLFYEDNAYNFQKVFKDAIATYGIPKKTYLDNGSSFRNSQLSYICAEVGTILIHTPIRDGSSKGKIERFFLTVKERFLYGFDYKSIHSLAEFNVALNEYIRTHNLTINSSTKCTPMERFLATRNHAAIPKSREWLNLCFMNRITRKVRTDSTITIENNLFDAPIFFIGQTVEIRFLPDMLEEAFIYEQGNKYPLKLTDKVANSKTKRNLPTIDYSKEVHPYV